MKKIVDNRIEPFFINEIEGTTRQNYNPPAYMRNGSIYLTKQDEIGMHFKEQYNKKIYSEVLENIIKKNPRHRYLININPKNTRMKDFIKNQGFRLIQHTYEISKKD